MCGVIFLRSDLSVCVDASTDMRVNMCGNLGTDMCSTLHLRQAGLDDDEKVEEEDEEEE